ncbi:uncharacterized protein MONBRDRAFT_27446 [Monosiga brevicollis MX1]|uniref:Nudix hydrolase domain-containing protein n=1 Tax=Monosiga brevicollis TaxID=81824 RepID=A9V5A7_MONBE|nr:uncharacterized protein MONBRDRAFT_27446 [Monosiga brevicollis MX1]EDQ87245.1 predicted protein [Monosiga brevicollis MX1]|eukprot:XP_001747858.1 hypothetical protein [Monosiga brevicollis MX1]
MARSPRASRGAVAPAPKSEASQRFKNMFFTTAVRQVGNPIEPVPMSSFFKVFRSYQKPAAEGTQGESRSTTLCPDTHYGTLQFKTHGFQKQAVPYLRLAYRTPATVQSEKTVKHAVFFSQLCSRMRLDHFGHTRPNLIISVTGGAKSFHLSPLLIEAIRTGIMRAAAATDAWVITGGTNTGVMKLVGDFMNDLNKDKFIPTIGIATWGIVHEAEKLAQALLPQPNREDRLDVEYAMNKVPEAKGSKCNLDSGHNLFLLVDDGTDSKFGGEIAFRAAFERQAHDAVVSGTPVVVIDGTGMVADLLAYAYNFTHSTLTRYSTYSVEALRQQIRGEFPDWDEQKVENTMHKLFATVVYKDKMFVYNIRDSAGENIDEVILDAISQGSHVSFKTKLLQAMSFDRIDMARRLLAEIHDNHLLESEEDIAEALNTNLMEALMNNMPHFVQLYLEYGATARNLQPTPEFKAYLMELRSDANLIKRTNLNKSVSSNPEGARAGLSRHATALTPLDSSGKAADDVQTRTTLNSVANTVRIAQNMSGPARNSNTLCGEHLLLLAMEQLYFVAGGVISGHVYRLRERSTSLNAAKPHKEPGRPFRLKFMEAILGHLAGSEVQIQRDWSLLDDGVTSPEDELALEMMAMNMLFLWAVCLNKYRLSEIFWQMGDESIANALIGSNILSKLARHRALSSPHLETERVKALHNADKLEELAVGVLSTCHRANLTRTSKILHEKLDVFGGRNIMEVAYRHEKLRFLSHPATQSLVSQAWYGDIREINPTWQLLLALFCPLLIPTVRIRRDDVNDGVLDLDFEDTKVEGYAIQGDQNALAALPSTESRPNRTNTVTSMASARTQSVKSNQSLLTYVNNYNKHVEKTGHLNAAELWIKAKAFYSSPFVKFISDCLAHLMLTLLVSYYALNTLEDYFSFYEYLILFWFVTITLAEIIEYVEINELPRYFGSIWNIIDTIMLAGYYLALVVRISNLSDFQSKTNAKLFIAFVVLILWLRFMRYYAVSKDVGPKLIMLFRMTRDVIVFVFIIAVFIFSYGVAAQSILWPQRDVDAQTFENVLYRPYFQIYGELFLEEMNAESDCVGPEPFSSCGYTYAWVLPPLLALYILVTNIVLINLLIAMFADTYQRVNEEARELWHSQNFDVYNEYHTRTVLPGPLAFFSHVWTLARMCLCCKPQDEYSSTNNEELARIRHFQEWHTDKFLADRRHRNDDTPEELMAAVRKQNTNLLDVIGEMQEKLVMMQMSLNRQGRERDLPATRPATRAQSAAPNAFRRMSLGRVRAVQYRFPPLKYPESEQLRLALNNDQVPWTTSMSNYNPPDYTAEELLKEPRPEWADGPDPRKYGFNKVEMQGDSFSTDRTSTMKVVVDSATGRPINPYGRTGLSGRGSLGRWGPNWAANCLITRWRRDVHGNLVERDGRCVLEFLAIERQSFGGWALPGGFRNDAEDRRGALERLLKHEIYQQDKLTQVEVDNLEELFDSAHTMRSVYSHDPRNTDNAWVEVSCANFHDETGELTKRLHFKENQEHVKRIQWLMAHSGLNLFASHGDLVREACQIHNAYF